MRGCNHSHEKWSNLIVKLMKKSYLGRDGSVLVLVKHVKCFLESFELVGPQFFRHAAALSIAKLEKKSSYVGWLVTQESCDVLR